jgi:glycosyltransferase involved in cell wall biosynthesis
MATTPLSIGLVSPGWPAESFPNGIATYLDTVVPQLRAAGHRVALLAMQVGQGVEDGLVYDARRSLRERSLARRAVDGLWYRAAPEAASRALVRRQIVETARRMAEEQAIQLLEVEESFGWGWWLRRALSRPVVVRLHGPWFLIGPMVGAPADRAFSRRVDDERRAIAAADMITAPAQDVLRRVREHYGLALDRAAVIPNPVAPVAPGQRWRLQDCDPKQLLFVGRFDRVKGGDLVIEAFARVLRRVPDARLVLVGPDRGCIDDQGRTWPLEPFVRDRLPGALESGRVEWLGQQPFTALAPLRRRALATVVCSRYENFPYTATEAMALGCPVVAARVGGVPELIRHGENGLLHAGGDAADLAEQLVELLQRPELAARLGERAGVDCERHLYPVAVASRLADLYGQVVEERSR